MESVNKLKKTFFGNDVSAFSEESYVVDYEGNNKQYLESLIRELSQKKQNMYPVFMFYNFLYEHFRVRRYFLENTKKFAEVKNSFILKDLEKDDEYGKQKALYNKKQRPRKKTNKGAERYSLEEAKKIVSDIENFGGGNSVIVRDVKKFLGVWGKKMLDYGEDSGIFADFFSVLGEIRTNLLSFKASKENLFSILNDEFSGFLRWCIYYVQSLGGSFLKKKVLARNLTIEII